MLDTSNNEPVNANRNDIESDLFRDENKEKKQYEKQMKANDEEKLDGDCEKDNTPLLRVTKKRSLLTAQNKPQAQRRIKRDSFLSPLSNGETEIENESNINNYTSSRSHQISNPQSTSFHSIDLKEDTNDEMKFISERSRIVVIYERQR